MTDRIPRRPPYLPGTPEGLHWIENHDSYAFEATRIELKG